ncbi:MAG: flavodoxin [Spirochaetaceae bacterium]|nr:flavodoxin [Spirochaetaceae bacterium]
MKKLFLFTIILFCMGINMELQAQNQNQRILIAYFSWSGNTRIVAQHIHLAVGGDIFEIKPAKPYPTNYQATLNIARQELQTDDRPELESNVSNMAEYDIIFLGFPNWLNTIPMIIYTFLESHDFRGKTIIPFCTHGSGGLGRSIVDIRRLTPGATLLEPLGIRGADVRNSQNDVIAWLRRLNMVR